MACPSLLRASVRRSSSMGSSRRWSSTMRPSRMRTMRCVACATRRSCVTTTMVVPCARFSSAKQLQDFLTALAVQRTGWLVGQDQQRIVGQGARHGDALALSAGKLIGQVVLTRSRDRPFPAVRGRVGDVSPRRRPGPAWALPHSPAPSAWAAGCAVEKRNRPSWRETRPRCVSWARFSPATHTSPEVG